MADAWGASWGGTFIVWGAVEQVTIPTFGPPFVDVRSPLLMTLWAASPVISAVGVNAHISPHIEFECHLPSSRIDRSLS